MLQDGMRMGMLKLCPPELKTASPPSSHHNQVKDGFPNQTVERTASQPLTVIVRDKKMMGMIGIGVATPAGVL